MPFQGKSWKGRVAEIRPKGDPISKSYRVRITLPDETPLQIGMTVEVNILVEEVANALLAPKNALVDSMVWVVEQGRAKPVEVRTGIRGTERVQIIEGLQGDERLIMNPPPTLQEGTAVRVIDQADSMEAP
ncbi:MAG: hypothetical protein C4294_08755 [Nitrospiraceae bacterium]